MTGRGRSEAEAWAAFGPYRLIRLLGRGGMAEVWRALHVEPTGRTSTVALKRILPHLCDDQAVVDMFLGEARLARRLVHPNLVRTLHIGTVARQPYIAMELLDGIDLRRLSHGQKSLPIGLSLSLVRDVCLGLAHAHGMRDGFGDPLGLIHRDISPANVMVLRDGSVKLLDFGVAKAGGPPDLSRTRPGQIKGKLGYLAPEMLRNAPYDQRVDLFAVGVVLFELLTQRRLFAAAEEGRVLWLNACCDVPLPSSINPRITPALDAIVLRALAREPAQRYRQAAELAAALDEQLARTPWRRGDTVKWLRKWTPAAEPSNPGSLTELVTAMRKPLPAPPRARRGWAAALLLVTAAGCVAVSGSPVLRARLARLATTQLPALALSPEATVLPVPVLAVARPAVAAPAMTAVAVPAKGEASKSASIVVSKLASVVVPANAPASAETTTLPPAAKTTRAPEPLAAKIATPLSAAPAAPLVVRADDLEPTPRMEGAPAVASVASSAAIVHVTTLPDDPPADDAPAAHHHHHHHHHHGAREAP